MKTEAIINRGQSVVAPIGAAAVIGESPFSGWWIEPEDFEIISFADDTHATIEVAWTQEMNTLLTAYSRGEVLCYDGDPDVRITDPESGGNPKLEIFWAVKYRGGLDIVRSEGL